MRVIFSYIPYGLFTRAHIRLSQMVYIHIEIYVAPGRLNGLFRTLKISFECFQLRNRIGYLVPGLLQSYQFIKYLMGLLDILRPKKAIFTFVMPSVDQRRIKRLRYGLKDNALYPVMRLGPFGQLNNTLEILLQYNCLNPYLEIPGTPIEMIDRTHCPVIRTINASQEIVRIFIDTIQR
jgi:hypothetical protein